MNGDYSILRMLSVLVKEIYLACIKFSRAPKHQVHTLMKLVTIILTKG